MKFIRFFANKHFYELGAPVPAKSKIPEWYRLSESFFQDESTQEQHEGLKKCMPFMDTLLTGYLLTFPVNVYVNEKSNDSSLNALLNTNKSDLSIRWEGPDTFANLISERPKALGEKMPRPAGHHPNHLIFGGRWSMQTPRGWSLLMVPPLNRYDLPFTASSGIIDSDKFTSPGNIPFFMKEGFSGVIPAGTPFVQLIPIKRAEWQMVAKDPMLQDKSIKEGSLIRDHETSYKKIMWQRKKYN